MNTFLKTRIAAKKNRKKGFTLIEVIVVIVIIAILAAIAVPSLTKYIGSAEKREVQATAHNIQVVLQAEKSENYDVAFNNVADTAAVDKDTKISNDKYDLNGDGTPEDVTYDAVFMANGMKFTYGTDRLRGIEWDGNTLSKFTYANDKYQIAYNQKDGGFDVVKPVT